MPTPDQDMNIDLEGVIARSNAAQHIVAGFAAGMPTLEQIWRYLEEVFNDVPVLAAEITRLAAELKSSRLDHADLLAAARATIAAYHDGEPDPLSYLRDEVNERAPRASAPRGHS